MSTPSASLVWTHRVLSADDVRRLLAGHHHIVLHGKVVVTPLAWEELKARRIQVTHQHDVHAQEPKSQVSWVYVNPAADPVMVSVVAGLARQGIALPELPLDRLSHPGQWVPFAVAETQRRLALGCFALTREPMLVCCLANKHALVRAAAVNTVAQVRRAVQELGVNFLAVESPGRTAFELRQMVTLAQTSSSGWPPELASIFAEVERHARR